MADHSKIEWTEATWNPVTGCNKISPGCKNCYAEREWKRLSANPQSVYYGRKFTDVATHSERLAQPLRWRRPRRIFVNSMSDLFHEKVSFEFIAAVFGVMNGANHHTYQILTKRPERMLGFFEWLSSQDDEHEYTCEEQAIAQIENHAICHLGSIYRPHPLKNVWLGISAENQTEWNSRCHALKELAAQGWNTWASLEPLLGPIDLLRGITPTQDDWETLNDLTEEMEGWDEPEEFIEECEDEADWINFGSGLVHSSEHKQWERDRTRYAQAINLSRWLKWVVTGGESGNSGDVRFSNLDWFRAVEGVCSLGKIPFLHKQRGNLISLPEAHELGINLSITDAMNANSLGNGYAWVPKKKTTRLLDGQLHNNYPSDECSK